jgi:unspecific monooxygenase
MRALRPWPSVFIGDFRGKEYALGVRTFHLELNAPSFVYDPYPILAELRETLSVFYDEGWNKVFFLRYDDISALLRDKRLGRAVTHILSRDEFGWPPPSPLTRDFDHFQENHMLDNEPPKHTRLKGLMLKAFTPARVEGLRGKIQSIVNGLLDRAEDAGRMDLLADYAEPLPVTVIAELLGVPEEDRPLLRPWSASIVKLYELGYTEEQARAANRAVVEFSEYIKRLADERRKRPGQDLISALVEVEEQGEKLTADELVANCILLLNAGHEATVNGTTAGFLALSRNPDQMELAKEAAAKGNVEFFKPAVEELLRYDTPLPMFERWVLEDLEIGGVPLKKGQEVALMYASGNRDPRKFPDPDRLNLTRKENQHLTFGLGIHYCIGAPLARLELQTSFLTLLKRLPEVHLATDTVEYAGGFVIRGHKAMPVEF